MGASAFHAMQAMAPEQVLLREFVCMLPWPVIMMDGSGHVEHVSGEIPGSTPIPLAHGSAPTLESLFPQYHAALRGPAPHRIAQEAELTREVGCHTVHERLILRLVSTGAYLIVIDQTAHCMREVTNVQTSRLAALGFMVAGVCHEVSNPITSVQSMVQILQAQKNIAPALLEKGLANIAASTKRLLDISSRLMNFGRVANQTGCAFSVTTLVEEAVAIIQHDPRAARLEVVFVPATDVMIFGSMSCMQEVLVNIFENALQAMDGVGTLDIRIARPEAERVAIEIRDTGPGISHQAMHRIFEPFFTTKAAGQGSGLGLSISNEFLLEHNGSITAENNPGGGACFRIELPVHRPAP